MKNVYIIATACTPFGKHADCSFQDLARMAYLDALADCGLAPSRGGGDLIEQAWFGNCGMGQWEIGRASCRERVSVLV